MAYLKFMLVTQCSVMFLAGCSSTSPIEVALPSADAGLPGQTPIVVIASDGAMSVAGQPTESDQIGAKLLASGVTKSSPVKIQAASDTWYSAVMAALNALKKAGFTNVSFVTRK